MRGSRLRQGQSDPISYKCTCSALSIGGLVLLFYRYWSNIPRLPLQEAECTENLDLLAAWYEEVTERLNLTGKIRIATEGFNVTVAGTRPETEEFMHQCSRHWSFAGLPLTTNEEKEFFFKPSNGCACVFGSEMKASIRMTAEITPMGIEGYTPSEWESIEALPPAEFHERCHKKDSLLLDVRNVYESRIGYFIDPHTREPAVRPPIRRFSQWPQYIEHHLQDMQLQEKQILTYCTGGIRCEKATRWMHDKITGGSQMGSRKIYTLQGGIAAYLSWMGEEIKQGRKQPSESLFLGHNYVFDARGSISMSDNNSAVPLSLPVSKCHICATPSNDLSKCQSRGCHLILVVCHACEEKKDQRCCQDCRDLDGLPASTGPGIVGPRPMCLCERQREMELWGGERVKVPKTQGWKTAKKRRALSAGERGDGLIPPNV